MISKKLLNKVEKQFPEIKMPKELQLRNFVRVRGGDRFSSHNRIVFKWANFGAGDSHVFSFDTMSDCLKNEIMARRHHGISGGWEIFVKGGPNDY